MPNRDTIKRIEEKIDELPLGNMAVYEIISLLENPDSNFEQILERLTPEITTKFLQMANSAFYGRQVRTINYAVRVLGYSGMKHILLTSALINHFAKHSDLGTMDFEKFQKQARFCAAVSRVLGEIVDYGKQEDLFTVAMLHDIGKVVMAVYFSEERKAIDALNKSENITASEAERRVMGIAHAEIGYRVLKKFNISREICDAVRSHDATDPVILEESNFELVMIMRETVKLVDHFSLPEDDPLRIIDQLRGLIKKGQERYRQGLREEMRSEGYRDVFPVLLGQASELIDGALMSIVPERRRRER